MASVGHLVVGAACGRAVCGKAPGFREFLWAQVLMIGLAVWPDGDFIGLHLGIAYGAPLGHRGAAHSLLAALAAALLATLLARLTTAWPVWKIFIFALLAAVSHPLLDAMTTGGRGIEFFWPFSDARHFLPWRPIPVAPLGSRLLSARGIALMANEFAWFSPLAVYAWFPRRWFAR